MFRKSGGENFNRCVMNNPWKDIDLNSYEAHMSLESVHQLQAMNQMIKEQFSDYDVESIMILGVAGGNGLEHIDRERIKCVYGVDINQEYLNECSKRSDLDRIFKPVCADLSEANLKLPYADLLVANLLIEYIGYDCFQNAVKTVNPKYVSCIIQINTDTFFVSDSPYLHIFDRLDEIHHQIQEDDLADAMQEIGYISGLTDVYDLPNGKKLVRLDFINSALR